MRPLFITTWLHTYGMQCRGVCQFSTERYSLREKEVKYYAERTGVWCAALRSRFLSRQSMNRILNATAINEAYTNITSILLVFIECFYSYNKQNGETNQSAYIYCQIILKVLKNGRY